MITQEKHEEDVKALKEFDEELPSAEEFEDYSEKLKALSDPTRLKILYLLSKRSCCSCTLQETLDKPQSNISHHLKILKIAGFIEGEKSGVWINFKIKDPAIVELLDGLLKLID